MDNSGETSPPPLSLLSSELTVSIPGQVDSRRKLFRITSTNESGRHSNYITKLVPPGITVDNRAGLSSEHRMKIWWWRQADQRQTRQLVAIDEL
jgi:hypothetical protein